MHADLVRPPRQRSTLDQRRVRYFSPVESLLRLRLHAYRRLVRPKVDRRLRRGEHLELRRGLLAVGVGGGNDRPCHLFDRTLSDRRVDRRVLRPIPGRHAQHERQVRLSGRLVPELFVHGRRGFARLGEQEHPARVHVQAVHDERQLSRVPVHPVDHAAALEPVLGRRDRERRLVQPEQRVVLVDHVDGVVVGRHRDRLARRFDQALCPLLRSQVLHLREHDVGSLLYRVAVGVHPPERDIEHLVEHSLVRLPRLCHPCAPRDVVGV